MITEVKPTAPVLNLNGTSAETLLEEYQDAYSAILKALRVVQQVTVNGRDYQTAPHGTYEKARAEHLARLEKLQSIVLDFSAIIQDVQDQEDARKRR